MPIVDIQRRFRELGRIRLGKKGARGAPQKLTTFRLTSNSERLLQAAAAIYGGKVKEWKTEKVGEGEAYELITKTDTLDIIIPPNQPFSQFWELWSGGGCQKRCDGERQVLRDVPCSCPEDIATRLEQAASGEACKPATRFNVILPDIPDIGVWRMETHGFYAAMELGAMSEITELATSRNHMVPARLRLEQRSKKRPGQPRHDYVVPVVELPPTMDKLLKALGVDVEQPTLSIAGPVERKGLPGGAPDPEDKAFALEQGEGGVEEASLPGAKPALPDDPKPRGSGARASDSTSSHRDEEAGSTPASRSSEAKSSGNGAAVTRSAAPAPEQSSMATTQHPCPVCGADCVQRQGPKKKFWICSNNDCPGDDKHAPWSSFHTDPWKKGGQIEQMQMSDGGEEVKTRTDDEPRAGGSEPSSKATNGDGPGGEPDARLEVVTQIRKILGTQARVLKAVRAYTQEHGGKVPNDANEVAEVDLWTLEEIRNELEKAAEGARR